MLRRRRSLLSTLLALLTPEPKLRDCSAGREIHLIEFTLWRELKARPERMVRRSRSNVPPIVLS